MAENDLPGWEGEALHLLEAPGIRAWVSPSHGGSVVGLAIEATGGWRQVLHQGTSKLARERPTRYGCPVLFPFPGLMRDATYWWEGTRLQLPPNAPDGTSFAHGFAHDRPWSVVASDVHRIAREFATEEVLSPNERQGYPFAVRLRQEIELGTDGLSVSLSAVNEGDSDAPVGLGLHPYVAMSFLGGDRSNIVVEPRSGDAFVPIHLSASGQELHTRTELPSSTSVHMRGTTGEVTVYLDQGVTDLAVFAPEDGQSVSLEPTTCELSAGSLLVGAESTADSALRLAPGETRRLAVRWWRACWNRSRKSDVE